MTLALARRLKAALEARLGVRVILSRDSDAIKWSRACRSAGSSTITNTSEKNRSTNGPKADPTRIGLAWAVE